MADTRNKISYFLKQVQDWLPYIIKSEAEKQQQKRDLENSLREILARGEESRGTIEAQRKSDYMNMILGYFKGRTSPELAGPGFMQKTSPGILPAEVALPPNAEEQLNDANAALMQFVKDQEAGNPQSEENVRKIAAYFGPDILQKGTSEAINVSEAAKARSLEARRATAQEEQNKIDLKNAITREKELVERIGGKIGDMTGKEVRDALTDLGKERRALIVKRGAGIDDWGEPLSKEALAGFDSAIAEIEKLELELKSPSKKEGEKGKPSAHPKGEKIFNPQKNGWYIWDGKQWILSKTGQ